MIFSLLPVPQSLWAGPGCRRAGNLLGLIRPCVHVGQAGLDEEQMRRLVPAGIPGARIVEGYAHVVHAPGESAVTDLPLTADSPMSYRLPANRQLRTFPLKRQVEQTISISAPHRTASSHCTHQPRREMSSKVAIR